MRFLHDAVDSGLDSYYKFRDGYIPMYTLAQHLALEGREERKRAEILYRKVVDDDQQSFELELRGLATVTAPEPHQWIIHPRVKLSVGRLEFFVQVHRGKWRTEGDDRAVHLALLNGRIEVRTYTDRRRKVKYEVIPVNDICNIGGEKSKSKSKSVSSRAANARGLYLIVSADSATTLEYIGRLVRRVCDVPDINCDRPSSNGLYLCQRVDLIPVPASRTHHREEIVEEEPFEIHYEHLVQICLSEALNLRGNQLMFSVRQRYGGNTLPCDDSDSKEKAMKYRKRRWEVLEEDLVELEQRIERIRRGGSS